MKKTFFVLLVFFFWTKIVVAQSPYIGEIRIFAGNFEPNGWAFCDGRLLPIVDNETLFQLIGTTYGGDGQSTFALPDLRGRVPVGIGQGSGLNNVIQGEKLGVEQVTLTGVNMPSHTHQTQISVSTTDANLAVPTANTNIAKMGTLSGRVFVPALSYNTSVPDVSIGNVTTSSVGNSQPISIMKPSLGVNYIISLYGIFPSQN